MALKFPDTAYVKSLLSSPPTKNSPLVESTIEHLSLQVHPEGGFYVETERDPLLIPNPHKHSPIYPNASSNDKAHSDTRNASTTIHYLLTSTSPLGHFHRNKSRTIHTLHSGRGRYVIIHPSTTSSTNPPEIETFIVGHNLARGERLQWTVEGGKWKSSFLLPDVEHDEELDGGSRGGLLISETVVPGFEFCDHDFLRAEGLEEMLGREERERVGWMLLKGKEE